MEVSGFVERREQEGLFGAVLSGASARTVLTGMRGSGKSQLATAVAARCEAEGWELVVWVPAGSREAVLSGLVELGRELGVDVEDGPSREVIARRCLTALASAQGSNRLIVFDDVDSPDDLVGLVPRGEGVRVLVTTTRLADWEGAGWAHVPVGVFEREQSIGILLDRTDQSDRGAADAIAGALGDLPVAVVQAAATARRDRYTLAAYLEVLERTTLEEGVRRREGDEYPGAVGAALRLALQGALERIEDQSPRRGEVARVQLGVLSVLAAPGVPARWLEALDGGSDDARGALSELIDSSVCRLSEDGSKVMIHGLQGRVIREARQDEPESWGRIEEEAAGILGAVNVTAIPVRDSAGRRREALDLVEQLRAVAEQDHSKTLFSSPRTAHALTHALRYAAELGDPQAALSLSDAVNLLDETLGPDHPRTLASRNNLAHAYRSAGRLKEAIDLYERTLEDRERLLEPDHTDTLASRNNLAHVYRSAGRLKEAIDLYERTLEDRERTLGPDHPDTLASRGGLAGAYRSAGRLDEAIGLLERTLADCERVLGPDYPHTLTARDGLAAAYRAAGRLDQAIDLLEQTLADYERALSPDHPDTRLFRDNLADTYRAVGRSEDTKTLASLSASTADLLARTTLPGLDDDDAREVRRILEDPEYAELVAARHRALVAAGDLARSLSTREVADMTGRSPAAIARSAGRSLYAYHLGRSLRFPTWQFDGGRPLPGLATVVPALREGLTPMTVEARMTSADPEILDGLSPVEWLARGGDPTEATRVLIEMDHR